VQKKLRFYAKTKNGGDSAGFEPFPAGEIRHEIPVEVPRAQRMDFSLRPEFAEYKRKIRDILMASMAQSEEGRRPR